MDNALIDSGSISRPNAWLNAYAKKFTSQYGEDGIVRKILEVIGENDKWCVEFGSWDGKKCSNTFSLITDKEYSAVLIEANQKRFKNLLKTFEGNNRVILLNEFVGFDEKDGLDCILKTTPIPENFDFLSIDIDGNDYYAWDAVKKYRPKVVVIEFNPTIHKSIEFVQPKDPKVTQGSSLRSIDKLARSKGYELVVTTKTNAFFVDSKYFKLFGIGNNSVEVMMTDESFITHIFCGYDGTVFLRGSRLLPWQMTTYKEFKVQQLPRWARKVVGDRNIFRRKFGKIYRRWCKKGLIGRD